MSARILIVEDNPANLRLMTYLLQSFGHVPLAARDGEEALDIVHREPLDLTVCDLQLPKIDGYQIARRLKSDPILRQIPLVAVSALAMVGDRDKALAAGFDGYISKPIVPRTFVQEVEAFLPSSLHSTPRAAVPTIQQAAAPAGERATVLVVDNLPVNIALARKILEPSGYRVVSAGGVSEALVLARREPPDLVLSDLHMPEADGHDLIRAIKADPALRAIPLILISSSAWNARDEEVALALGAARFLARPMEPQALLKEVAACLPSPQGG